MLLIDQTSVAAHELLSFMLKVELFADRSALCLWLKDQREKAEGAEIDFYHAALRYVEAQEETPSNV